MGNCAHRPHKEKLWTAAQSGNVAALRSRIAKSTRFVNRAAHVAARNDHVEALQLLMHAKARVHGRMSNEVAVRVNQWHVSFSSTWLLASAVTASAAGAVALLARTSTPAELVRALAIAVEARSMNSCLALLAAKVDVTARTEHQLSPFVFAAKTGQADMVAVLVQARANLDGHDSQGDTALFGAVNRGNWRAAETLLRARADVNAHSDANEFTYRNIMWVAAARCDRHHDAEWTEQQQRIGCLLMEAKAGMHVHGRYDRTPFPVILCLLGNVHAVRTLLVCKADANARVVTSDMTALEIALESCRTGAVAKLLLAAKANVSQKELKAALRSPHTSTATLARLLTAKGDLTMLSAHSPHLKALHLAVCAYNADVVTMLLKLKEAPPAVVSALLMIAASSSRCFDATCTRQPCDSTSKVRLLQVLTEAKASVDWQGWQFETSARELLEDVCRRNPAFVNLQAFLDAQPRSQD